MSTKIYSQDKFRVSSLTVLKLNTDDYAYNNMQIFQGEIVKKNSNSSFILINFNDETGYVNKIDLVTFSVNGEG